MEAYLSLKGRVAIVTGASRNIGYEAAKALAKAGAAVVVNGLDGEALQRVAEELRTLGAGAAIAAGDICEERVTREIAAVALKEFGGVDILVNNALIDGGADQCPTLETSRRSWDRKFEGYVHAPLRLIHDLQESMCARGHGSVINVISGVAFTPIRGMGAYGVSKAAMLALTRQLARELAPEIRVNAVCPGTTSMDGQLLHEGMRPLLARVPLHRMGRAEETARAILHLASDASSYTTGAVLFADGGRTELIAPD